ncbi:MAG: hypothetical protein A4E25_01408 [Methanobacterium sp. PtaB.Bin024]|nr:MAG: hypothetical protein A4E25_01408 [Methanobacterium sp. PtaB.Bin024]
MNIYNALINFILFGLMFIFPLMIYLNLRKYKTAALGRLFSNKSQTIRVFQFFAVAMIIYSFNVFINILKDFYQISLLNSLYIITSIILSLLLIYVFYKLYRIMKL